MGLTSSRHFSLYMSRLTTPANPPESHQMRFFCIGFRSTHNVAICIVSSNDAKFSFRDVQIPCDLHSSLCTLRLTFVHVCHSRNR